MTARQMPAPERDTVPTIASVSALRERIGAEPIVSDWIELDQARVDRFADATGDRQWIHVDPDRARAESPFGGAIAHGFLTLSCIPALLAQTVRIRQRMALNYGLNRVRFTSPVAVGSRVRASFAIADASDVEGGGVQVTWNVTVELEAASRPACVAEFVTRHYF